MNMASNPMQDVLRTAIQREIDAYNLYSAAAESVDTAHAKDLLKELAAQELGHRNRLESLLAGNVFRVLTRTQQKKFVDLKITDYLTEEPLTTGSDFQDILIVAGKREKASFELYSALSRVSNDPDTTKLFDFLANEELGHKHRVESLYDELVYREN
jgi:rubrerythrin